MINILYFILGYRRFEFKHEDLKKLVSIFISNDINVKISDNSFVVPLYRLKKIQNLLNGKIEYSLSEALGFGGFIYKNRKRYGAFFAIIFSFILLIASENIVWDVRIEGAVLSSKDEIVEELSKNGLRVGMLWTEIDKSEVEIDMLINSDLVSWININRRGGVAYVSVIDKVVYDESEETKGFSNIVATCDAVIEEINVISGYPVVSPGDSVKKGDLLISGVIPSEYGGGFCYAKGRVVGRVSDTLSVFVDSAKSENNYKDEILESISLKIFDFSINIFKSYRNLDAECDIIENKTEFDFFGIAKLPFSVVKKIARPYSVEVVTLTAEEMTEIARAQLTESLSIRLREATLLKIKTEGAFLNTGYQMCSYIVCTQEIGRDLAFQVGE